MTESTTVPSSGRLLWNDGLDLSPFERRPRHDHPWQDPRQPRRLHADPERVERGLAQLVLTVIELLRQLMERQALRRLEHGTLTDVQEEQLGTALMRLAETMEDLKQQFDLTDEDLNLHLGPLGDLL